MHRLSLTRRRSSAPRAVTSLSAKDEWITNTTVEIVSQQGLRLLQEAVEGKKVLVDGDEPQCRRRARLAPT